MATCKQSISIFVFVFRSTYYPLVIGMFPPALRQFENQVEAEVAVEVAEFRSYFLLDHVHIFTIPVYLIATMSEFRHWFRKT